MSNWKIARDYGNRIARELRLRKASEIVHRDEQRRFDRLVANLAEHPDERARSRLSGALEAVPRRRELQTAVALLDNAWRVPAGSRLEEDIVLTIRRCYLDAPREEWRERIRDELRDRQWHPFPNVRRVVLMVRQLDPVDALEVQELLELERGFPDLRASITERIVIHGQMEHLDALVDYLSSALGLPQDRPERIAAARLYSELGVRLPRTPQTLATLYNQYLARYEETEPRGFLMRALAAFGDAIVAQLVDAHGADDAARLPIEHLLMLILRQGNPLAARALFELLRDAPRAHMARLCRFLDDGVRQCVSHGPGMPGTEAVLAVVTELLPSLERLPYPEVKRLRADLLHVAPEPVDVSTLVSRIAEGKATEFEMQALRRRARHALPRLVEAVRDPGRPSTERIRALRAFERVRQAATHEVAAQLFDVFRATPELELRIAVLDVLALLRRDPGGEARRELAGLARTGEPDLRDAIERTWQGIFRATDLTDGGDR